MGFMTYISTFMVDIVIIFYIPISDVHSTCRKYPSAYAKYAEPFQMTAEIRTAWKISLKFSSHELYSSYKTIANISTNECWCHFMTETQKYAKFCSREKQKIGKFSQYSVKTCRIENVEVALVSNFHFDVQVMLHEKVINWEF